MQGKNLQQRQERHKHKGITTGAGTYWVDYVTKVEKYATTMVGQDGATKAGKCSICCFRLSVLAHRGVYFFTSIGQRYIAVIERRETLVHMSIAYYIIEGEEFPDPQ